MNTKDSRHAAAMKKQKESVDRSMQKATTEKGICILLTGNGKGKTSSAFGIVMRALGYGQQIAIVQFIKGTQKSGEELYIKKLIDSGAGSSLFFHQMGTGFTWETQNREADMKAAARAWTIARELLKDSRYNLVVLDELTYMLAYDYLDENEILECIRNRPPEQSVIITGRGGGRGLRQVADTVSDIKDVKHAYRSGIMARRGVDY
jgi:cob(I)alamin adenosyltransferase